MKLYQLPYSHFSAKVRIVALEKQIALDLPPIPGDDQSDEQYLAINPTGLVPCLVDGDLVLSESEVIAEYLNDKFPTPAMLPDSPEEKAFSRWLSRMHDLYVAPTLSSIYGLTLAPQIDTEAVDEKLNELFSFLDMVESRVSPDPYFCKGRYGISDASFGLSFWYALGFAGQFNQPITAERYPKLLKWFEASSERESFKQILNDCKQALGIEDAA